MADFFGTTPEQQNVVPIDARTLQQAELIIAREGCNDDAHIPFDGFSIAAQACGLHLQIDHGQGIFVLAA